MNRKTFWLLTAFEGGLGVLALLLLAVFDLPFSLLGNTGHGAWLWGLLAALSTYSVLVVALRLWPWLQTRLARHIEQMHLLFVPLGALEFALLAALAGVGEELLFRVWLQSLFDTWLPASVAIALSALIFAALHGLSVTYFAVTMVMGLALGAVYHTTQSVVLVATWHGVYDFIALIVLARRPHWLLPSVASRSADLY